MLRMVACESRRARTMPPRSPFKRVMPALSIATSVPVPMAMLTSAAASAGGIVDAVPGHGDDPPGLLQFGDHGDLLIRKHFCLDIGYPELACDGVGRGPVVPGQHDDLDAFRRQRL